MRTEKTVAVFTAKEVIADLVNRTFEEKELTFLGSYNREGEPIPPKEYKERWENTVDKKVIKKKMILETFYVSDTNDWITTTLFE